jgi:predicted phosphodiesterase
MSTSIAIISDLHFGSTEEPSRSNVEHFRNVVILNNDVKAVIVPGDLTSAGYDGIIKFKWLWRLLGKKNIGCIGGGEVNELGLFKDNFVTPLEDAGKLVLSGYGNHDTYNGAGRYPVLDWIRTKYGSLPYRRDISTAAGPVRIYMCGQFPDAGCREYLARELDTAGSEPIIIAFHYAMNSTWWSDADKNAFWDVIQDKNIKALVVGHTHESNTELWHDIPVFNASGSDFIILNLDTMMSEFVPRII